VQKPKDLPKFEEPPVIEVGCGVMFKSIDALLAPHLGLLWAQMLAPRPQPPCTDRMERRGVRLCCTSRATGRILARTGEPRPQPGPYERRPLITPSG
jgi:hypothetical protein